MRSMMTSRCPVTLFSWMNISIEQVPNTKPSTASTEKSRRSSSSSSRASNELTFSTTYTSFYETLLLVLGIAVPSPLYFESATTPIFACVIYLIMIFIVSIILINLLIAVMTERVSELNRHTTIIQTIQLISMSLLMERASTRSERRHVAHQPRAQQVLRRESRSTQDVSVRH